MNQKFSSLKLGIWFYPLRDDGSLNLEIILIKVGEMELVRVSDDLHLTPNALKYKRFNAVVIASPEKNGISGFLDYLPPNTLVLNCNYTC